VQLPRIRIRKLKTKLILAIVVACLAVTSSSSLVEKVFAAGELPSYIESDTPVDWLLGKELDPETAAALNGGCASKVSKGLIGESIPLFISRVGGAGACQSVTDPALIKCIMEDPNISAEQKKLLIAGTNECNGGMINIAFKGSTNLLKQRPLSTAAFLDDQLNKFVTGGPVYAADVPAYFPGSGFELLQPIQSFWGWAVTLSYSFMVIVILIVALGLMFRSNLGGKTQIKLQTAIQGIVMAMILIPLSYPISGLFIDAITIGTNAVHGFLFSDLGPAGNVYRNDRAPLGAGASEYDTGRGLYADDPRINFFNARLMVGLGDLDSVLQNSDICKSDPGSADCSSLYVSTGVFGVVDTVLGFFGSSIGSIIGGLVYAAFVIITIVTSLKIGWKLFKQYLTLLVVPLTLPFIFATLAIPGYGNKLAVDSVKKLANASVNFIVAYSMILIAIILTSPSFANNVGIGAQAADYAPPLLSNTIFSQAVEGLGNQSESGQGGVVRGVLILAGAGVFLLIPSTLKQITDQLAPKQKLPAFLTNIQNELTSSGDIALRQAPAYFGRAGKTVVNQSAGRLTRYIGGRKSDPFGKSNVEEFAKLAKENIEKDIARAAKGNFVTRRFWNASAAVKAAGASAVTNIGGKPTDFKTQGGEGKKAIETSFSFGKYLEGSGKSFTLTRENINSELGYVRNAGADKIRPADSLRFEGKLAVKPVKDSPAPSGAIYFKRAGGGGKIGEIGGSDIVLKNYTEVNVSGNTLIQPAGNLFSGTADASADFPIEFTLNSNALMPQSLKTKDKIEIFIGNPRDPNNGFTDKFDLEIKVGA
jgi:hypothetical protein